MVRRTVGRLYPGHNCWPFQPEVLRRVFRSPADKAFSELYPGYNAVDPPPEAREAAPLRRILPGSCDAPAGQWVDLYPGYNCRPVPCCSSLGAPKGRSDKVFSKLYPGYNAADPLTGGAGECAVPPDAAGPRPDRRAWAVVALWPWLAALPTVHGAQAARPKP